MNDEEYAAQKARVLALIDKWVKPIGLGWWRIEFCWSRTVKEGDDSDARNCLMDCTARWKYRSACITTYLPNVGEQSDAQLEWAFVHELMHVLVNETRETADGCWLAHEERVCSDLASAFIWLRDSLTAGTETAAELQAASPENRANGALHHLVEVV